MEINWNEVKNYAIKIRRKIHQYPETRFELEKTCALVKNELDELGISYTQEYGVSSIVATIQGNKPGKTIALRADMDALDLIEENDIEYKSKIKGKMHACAHDGHVAMLLASAKLINQHKEKITGTIKLIFQSSEEGPDSGAKLLVEDGVMEDIENILALHITNEYETGTICANEGPATAAATAYEINIRGKGGHAGFPHKAIDAISIGIRIVNNFQYIHSRNINPFDPSVISVGKMNAGSATNIIAENCHIAGTIRTYSKSNTDYIKGKMINIVKSISELEGATFDIKFIGGVPPVINDKEFIREMKEAGIFKDYKFNYLEEANMGAEDFAYYLDHAKGAIIWLGSRNEYKGYKYPLHHAKFDFDEDVLEIGTKIFFYHCLNQLSI